MASIFRSLTHTYQTIVIGFFWIQEDSIPDFFYQLLLKIIFEISRKKNKQLKIKNQVIKYEVFLKYDF